VEGLAWSCDAKSYACGSVATGRVFHAEQFEGDERHKEEYPGYTGWGLGVGLTTPSHKKALIVEKLLMIAAGRQPGKMNNFRAGI
jgi:hypothetical protein